MKQRIRLTGLSVFTLFLFSHADTTITDTELDYSIYLPDNWVVEKVDGTRHHFLDTTGAYPALLSLVRYRRDPVDFPTSEEWTRAHFIAYTLTAEYSADPWGAVLYYDSTANCKQQELWAAEAYATYFTLDTALGSWAEYVRFTASGDYGYELYALSDTADLIANVGFYAGILQGIELPEESTGIVRGLHSVTATPAVAATRPGCLYDPRGRLLRALPRSAPRIVAVSPERTRVLALP
jgi:hypothetical protein